MKKKSALPKAGLERISALSSDSPQRWLQLQNQLTALMQARNNPGLWSDSCYSPGAIEYFEDQAVQQVIRDATQDEQSKDTLVARRVCRALLKQYGRSVEDITLLRAIASGDSATVLAAVTSSEAEKHQQYAMHQSRQQQNFQQFLSLSPAQFVENATQFTPQSLSDLFRDHTEDHRSKIVCGRYLPEVCGFFNQLDMVKQILTYYDPRDVSTAYKRQHYYYLAIKGAALAGHFASIQQFIQDVAFKPTWLSRPDKLVKRWKKTLFVEQIDCAVVLARIGCFELLGQLRNNKMYHPNLPHMDEDCKSHPGVLATWIAQGSDNVTCENITILMQKYGLSADHNLHTDGLNVLNAACVNGDEDILRWAYAHAKSVSSERDQWEWNATWKYTIYFCHAYEKYAALKMLDNIDPEFDLLANLEQMHQFDIWEVSRSLLVESVQRETHELTDHLLGKFTNCEQLSAYLSEPWVSEELQAEQHRFVLARFKQLNTAEASPPYAKKAKKWSDALEQASSDEPRPDFKLTL